VNEDGKQEEQEKGKLNEIENELALEQWRLG
jgi:hypothetical protein